MFITVYILDLKSFLLKKTMNTIRKRNQTNNYTFQKNEQKRILNSSMV